MSAKKEKTWKFVPIVTEDYFPSTGLSLEELVRVVAKGEIKIGDYKARDESIGRGVRAGLLNVHNGVISPTAKLKEIVRAMATEQASSQKRQEERLKAAIARADKLKEKLAKTTELVQDLKKSA